jgi:hypothetical protein
MTKGRSRSSSGRRRRLMVTERNPRVRVYPKSRGRRRAYQTERNPRVRVRS